MRQVFQLHPNGYRFADGHVVKLELLPKDSNTAAGNSYGRTSNGQQNVTVENLELRLPVLEPPGSLGGLVERPGAEGAAAGLPARAGLPDRVYARPKGATPFRVALVPAYKECTDAEQHARAAARVPVLQPAAAGRPTTSRWGRRTPTASRPTPRLVSYEAVVGQPGTPADEADVRSDGLAHGRAPTRAT